MTTKDIEMADMDELEYDVISEDASHTDVPFTCFTVFDVFNRYLFTDYGRSVYFTQTINKIISKHQIENIIFIDDLVHGTLTRKKLEDTIQHFIYTHAKLIICFRIQGSIIDHIASMVIDCNHNTMKYFDSKGVNPMNDTRIIKGFSDDCMTTFTSTCLRPVNLCTIIRSIFLKHKLIEPRIIYNKEQIQSWWDFWSCGVHTLIHIEKVLYNADQLVLLHSER